MVVRTMDSDIEKFRFVVLSPMNFDPVPLRIGAAYWGHKYEWFRPQVEVFVIRGFQMRLTTPEIANQSPHTARFPSLPRSFFVDLILTRTAWSE